jgi:hypothetical protein
MDYIEQIMADRQKIKSRRKPKPAVMDPKFRQQLANFLVTTQMGEEPTAAQVAYKAVNVIKELVESDAKNVEAISKVMTYFNNIYRRG